MPDIRSSLSCGLELARAPRLRRLAELVDEHAPTSADPAKARKLARDMRLRASELETGFADHGDDQAHEVDPEADEIAFALGYRPGADGALRPGLDR